MQIKAESLANQLKQQIFPLYLVTGDEPYLVEEYGNLIRQHYRSLGYQNRLVFHSESSCNWQEFYYALYNLSLEMTKTLVELRLGNYLPELGGKIIQQYLTHPSLNNIVLITAHRIEKKYQKSLWYNAIQQAGVIIPVWPLSPTQFSRWLVARLKQAQLTIDQEGFQLLLANVAGNYYAAQQEINKLAIIYGQNQLTARQISEVITLKARFNLDNLLEAALLGDITRLRTILTVLRQEQQEPTLLLWQFTQALRALLEIKIAVTTQTRAAAPIKYNIFHGKERLVNSLLATTTPVQLAQLLKLASQVELTIKGGNPTALLWHELEKLYLKLSPQQPKVPN